MALRWLFRAMDKATLADKRYSFLFEPGPPDEVVSIDCETTGLDRNRDEIISISAIKIRGDRILASQAFNTVVRPRCAIGPEAIKIHGLREADVANAGPIAEVLPELLRFIGGRPLMGYYIDFDIAMLDNHVAEFIGVQLPNPRIEVSRIYYERKYGDAPPGTQIDLTFAKILKDMKLPLFNQHDAFADALMTAMIYVSLMDLKERGVRISRPRHKGVGDFHGG
ncbi:3'-5' exonuclease [uncultured Rhodoblastus sp.]|uniref:3'-5' exonuclease n=1 Tax=uncultured Rhodoblastus sp. TaxID=543037 RepID=UPI0025DAAC8E|nr:3'-5' exonuclease [uncultured Rhodoblastus sp.]